MKKTVVFIHIPKTAGSTFSNVLDRQYNNSYQISGLSPLESLDNFRNLPLEERKKYDCVKGHLTSDILQHIYNPLTITFLRDPIELFLSLFYYKKRAKWNKDYHLFKDLKLEDFIDLAPEIGNDNIQTRYLSETSTWHTSEVGKNIQNLNNDFLSKAKTRLDDIDYVLFVEDFDKSLLLLKKNLHWKNLHYSIGNRTSKRPQRSDIDKKIMDKIIELNKYDLELYQYARNNFEFNTNKISSLDLHTLKFKNEMFTNILKLIKFKNKVKGLIFKPNL